MVILKYVGVTLLVLFCVLASLLELSFLLVPNRYLKNDVPQWMRPIGVIGYGVAAYYAILLYQCCDQ